MPIARGCRRRPGDRASAGVTLEGLVGTYTALAHHFRAAARYQITVMDDAGRYNRIEISVR